MQFPFLWAINTLFIASSENIIVKIFTKVNSKFLYWI